MKEGFYSDDEGCLWLVENGKGYYYDETKDQWSLFSGPKKNLLTWINDKVAQHWEY